MPDPENHRDESDRSRVLKDLIDQQNSFIFFPLFILFYFSRLEQGHMKDNEFGGLFPCFPVLFIMDDRNTFG